MCPNVFRYARSCSTHAPDLFLLFSIWSTNETRGLCSFPLLYLPSSFLLRIEGGEPSWSLASTLLLSNSPSYSQKGQNAFMSLPIQNFAWLRPTVCRTLDFTYMISFNPREAGACDQRAGWWQGTRHYTPPKSCKMMSDASSHAPHLWHAPSLQSPSSRSLLVPHARP